MKDKRKHHGTVDEQYWNNSFVNPTWLPLFYRSSEAINLVQLDLTTGWHAGEMQVNFEFYKIHNT